MEAPEVLLTRFSAVTFTKDIRFIRGGGGPACDACPWSLAAGHSPSVLLTFSSGLTSLASLNRHWGAGGGREGRREPAHKLKNNLFSVYAPKNSFEMVYRL